MEGNALELALQQLAKSMGVALPAAPRNEDYKSNSISTVCESAERTAPDTSACSEEGEVTDEETPASVPAPSAALPSPAKLRERNTPRPPGPGARKRTLEFTGEVDAESILRGRTERKENKRPRPEATANSSRTTAAVGEKKPKVPCRYWMEGKCTKGEECTFSHALRPNKTPDEAKSGEVCRFHIAGSCLKGETCLYSHDLSQVPCKFFHVRGECGAGRTCRFSHAPISEEARHALFAETMGTRDPRLAPSEPSQPASAYAPPRPPPAAPAQAAAAAVAIDPAVQRYNPFGSPF